ncbi:MAG: hypothetical protein HY332_07680 [Chloroflexi bacterium]|nr:hypothetical protein [Chloroflexota bacterium]
MSSSDRDPTLPPEVDAALSHLIERWAARRQITHAEAAAVHQAVVRTPRDVSLGIPASLPATSATTTPIEFGYVWWQERLAPLGTALAQVRAGSGAAADTLEQLEERLADVVPGWATTQPGTGAVQLHLRLG